MKFYKKALEMDIQKDYEKAITYYEASIDNREIQMDAYINGAFIYWEGAVEFGWADKYNISTEIRKYGIDKSSQIIDEATKLFPNNPEPPFWKIYLFHFRFGELLSKEEVINILKEHNEDSIIPYFFLYLYEKDTFKSQRDQLLIECDKTPTAKNLYIKSIVEDRPSLKGSKLKKL